MVKLLIILPKGPVKVRVLFPVEQHVTKVEAAGVLFTNVKRWVTQIGREPQIDSTSLMSTDAIKFSFNCIKKLRTGLIKIIHWNIQSVQLSKYHWKLNNVVSGERILRKPD